MERRAMDSITQPLSGPIDAGLRARARQVVPGGLWGHLNAANLPPGYPQYFSSAEGCRIRDVDGRAMVQSHSIQLRSMLKISLEGI